jgi:hypothetical protein
MATGQTGGQTGGQTERGWTMVSQYPPARELRSAAKDDHPPWRAAHQMEEPNETNGAHVSRQRQLLHAAHASSKG